jgi:hypothetical protein
MHAVNLFFLYKAPHLRYRLAMDELPESFNNLKTSLQKLGVAQHEAAALTATLAVIVGKAMRSDPRNAAFWLESFANGLTDVARFLRGQPDPRETERLIQDSLAEEEA